MYHHPPKRKQLIRRTFIYGLMSCAVVGLVIVLVFVMLGYQFDRNDGTLEQGGLVQFDSRPTSATVTIDGASFGTRTPSKTTVHSGKHFITMNRTGYKTWQKSVRVLPGSVLWLNYTRLIPNELKPVNVANLSHVSSTAASPNGKWMAIHEDAATPAIKLADLSRDTVTVKTLALPADSYSHPAEGKPQNFSLETWDPDSRYILVKHTYDNTKVEWIVVDSRDKSAAKNVTTLLNIDASQIQFSPGDSTIIYAQIAGDVRKIDIDAATLSRPLVTNVVDFSLYDRSTLTYSTAIDPLTKTRSVGYYEDGTDAPQVIRSYTDDGQASLHIAIGEYFNEMYTAIAYGDSVEVLKGDLPTADTPKASLPRVIKSFAMPEGNTQYLSIMNDERFVVAQAGASYQVYDIELKKTALTTLKGVSDVTKELEWLDGYTLWSDRDSMVRLYEFDGSNQHNIMPVAPGFSASLSPNAKYLYGIGTSSDHEYHLKRVRLILP